MTVVLTGSDLTLDDLVRVARASEPVELSAGAMERMQESRAFVEHVLARGDPVYGMTTGVGMRKKVRIGAGEHEEFNRRMIVNHRTGQGPPFGDDIVRGAMVRLANSFATGLPGVRPELAERLVSALNDDRVPAVRSLGSVGLADLAPLADLAHGVFGTDRLAAKEGIALLNSGAFSTSLAALALADATRLAGALDIAAALDLEAFVANLTILHLRVSETRPYPGLAETVTRLRGLLGGSYLWTEGTARNLQDPVTFRCVPQMHGALRDVLAFTRRAVDVELNASQDNPLPIAAEDRIVSVSNFDVLPLAAALDYLRIGLAPVIAAACERSVKLLQAHLTDLPEGLAPRPGLAENSVSEFGISAQALAAEARLLAQPVSFELVSTSHAEGIEDRVTMAPLAARRLAEMVSLTERLVAIELVLAAQAVDLRGRPALGEATGRAYALVRELVPFMDEGDSVPQDLEPVVELVRSGALG